MALIELLCANLTIGEMGIPVVLVFIAYYGEHLSHRGVDAFEAVVSTRSFHMATESFDTKLGVVIGQKSKWIAPLRNELVQENVSSRFGRKFCDGDGEHVSEAPKAAD